MAKLFRYESNLVDTFQKNHSLNNNSIIIPEMKIRWGNIDLVEINNSYSPFTHSQCEVLSRPSCAKIFMRLKNKRGISKNALYKGVGLSESTFTKCLSDLVRAQLVVKTNDLYIRNIMFVFPNVIITGYEAKLNDYNKALYQATINREYVDYSYMVFPMDIAENILKKHNELVMSLHIGLIGVEHENNIVLIKSCKNKPIKPYIRLMNLALSYNINYVEQTVF